MTTITYDNAESIGDGCFIVKIGADSGGGDCYCAIRTSGPFSGGSDIRTGSALQRQIQDIGYRVSFLFTDLDPDTRYYVGAVVRENSSDGNTRTDSVTTLSLAAKVPGPPKFGVTN